MRFAIFKTFKIKQIKNINNMFTLYKVIILIITYSSKNIYSCLIEIPFKILLFSLIAIYLNIYLIKYIN